MPHLRSPILFVARARHIFLLRSLP